MGKKIELTGKTFGRLTVVAGAGSAKNRAALWSCRCLCGVATTVRGQHLRSGHTTSCGCAQRDAVSVHGQHNTPLYNSWKCMIHRCGSPSDKDYANYGGRGIAVSDRWRESNGRGFLNFVADMGLTYEPGLTIDRIDVNGNYEPDNCRWATPSEQTRGRRITRRVTFRGETKPIAEWCEEMGIRLGTVKLRLARGWSVERALTDPVRSTRASREN
ncbi:hypothetical protein OG786_29325 [Streptomyces sp. NBC_00101]|uniref:hypothetical protein n=1 Tax=Streptomyces sp. NBC_00101 TaxID=2975651 RepID=UPI003247B90B